MKKKSLTCLYFNISPPSPPRKKIQKKIKNKANKQTKKPLKQQQQKTPHTLARSNRNNYSLPLL